MPHPDRPWRDDEEDWSETDDQHADLDADTVPCPECGAAIFDDTDHCPDCGHWLTEADHRILDHHQFPSRRVRLVAIVLLVIFVLGILASFLGM